MTDLSTWYTKSQACAKLGNIAERTLDRLVERGKIRKRTRPMPGRKPEPVYSAEDIDKIIELTEARAAVLPPESNYPILRRKGAPAPSAALWLTYEEAAAYSGLPRRTLERLVRAGKLAAIRAGSTYIRRADIDAMSEAENDPGVHVRALLPLLDAVARIAAHLPERVIPPIATEKIRLESTKSQGS